MASAKKNFMETIGVIAGNGDFPGLVIREAKRQGYRVILSAIEKETTSSFLALADKAQWIKIGELKKLVRFFKSEGVTQAIMAGKVEKVRLFQGNVRPDLEMVKVVAKVRDFKDDSLLSGIADYLESTGIRLLDSTLFLKNAMPAEGILSKKKPSKELAEDIAFGFKTAKAIAGLDIGQTVAVKKKAVLAVEAIEGTDQTIRRAGELGGGKITIVKVAKPNQDMRFDVPCVGLHTLKELKAGKVAAFAFEAGKTIFLNLDEFIKEADRINMVVAGVRNE